MTCTKALRSAAVILSALSLAACTSLPGGARIDPETVQNGQPTFRGLLAAADGQDASSSTRYVFVVHGMGDTSLKYAEPLFSRIIDQGYEREETQNWVDARLPVPITVRGEAFDCATSTAPPCRFTSFGRFRVDTFVKDQSRRVVVYTFYWHEDLDRIQAPFLSADLQEPRAVLTRSLKRDIIIMGFGDATAYLGGSGELVRAGLSTGLCAMLRQAAGRPVPVSAGGVDCNLEELTLQDAHAFGRADFGFVTMSLGSRMLYDTLDVHARRADPVIPALARRTRYFFMLANQLPLLGLGRVTISPEEVGDATSDGGIAFDLPGESSCDRTAGFFVLAGCERQAGSGETSDILGVPPIHEALDVVAFHDPEDFLGFSAGKGMAPGSTGVRFVEVWNRNAAVYLGLFANPMKTHAAELDHDTSSQLILCGASARSNGRLRPYDCL